MADKSTKDAPANQENAQQPNISIHAQYIKDLSFENPGAPVSLTGEGAPEIDMSLDLHVQRLPEEGSFEVALQIEASAKRKDETLFVVELVYGAVFTLQGIPEEHHKSVLAVHCPAMIFPFARKIVADVTQDGGFQPLMIDPIDFAALYHRNMMQEQEAAEEGK